jgi:hypothetical protein
MATDRSNKRSEALSPGEVEWGSSLWWTQNPMSYDWDGEVMAPQFSPEWFDAIDARRGVSVIVFHEIGTLEAAKKSSPICEADTWDSWQRRSVPPDRNFCIFAESCHNKLRDDADSSLGSSGP